MSSTGGKFDDAKGRAKEAAGDLTDDEELKAEGKLDRASGKVKAKAAEAKDKVEDAVETVKGKLKRD